MLKMQFHGHAFWEISDESHRVLIDPFITGNPLAQVKPDSFQALDAIVITHGHRDHIGDAVDIAKRTGALVVSNFEIVTWFGAKDVKGHPMHIGGGREFPFGHVKFTIAHHGSTGPDGEALGNPMGVVLTMDGKRIYHAGDTGLFYDMKLIGEMYGPIDAALLPIGDNFTMGIDDAVKAVELIGPRVAIPMHYNTFDVIEVDPAEWARKVESKGGRPSVVQPGGTYEIS